MSVWSPSGSGEVHVDTVLPKISVGWEVRSNEFGRQCVYVTGTDQRLGCYDTHGEALVQIDILKRKEGGKMGETSSYLVSMETVKFSEGSDKTWIHALPFGSYKHPLYGTIDINLEKAQRFAESVIKKVRGIDPSINYNHKGGEEAAGWVQNAEVRADGVWLFVEWVKDAALAIKDKKYRYFSAEFADWEDSKGQTFKDVIVGGALTNRPFMKNLVPMNLSDSVIDNAFDLVAAITGKDPKENKEIQMEEKDLQAIIEGVTAKLTAVLPKLETPAPKTQVKSLEEVEELRKLAENNPVVKKLFDHYEVQATAIADQNKLMRETLVDAKLSEFDNSKLTLTPAAKELAREIMLEMPDSLTNKFWSFMEQVRTSQTFLVELGERSGAAVRTGFKMTDKTATQMFTELTNKLMADEKLNYLDAVSKVAANNRDLYDAYRAGDGAQLSR